MLACLQAHTQQETSAGKMVGASGVLVEAAPPACYAECTLAI